MLQVCIANRCREVLRPSPPRDLEFELEEDKLPANILRADVKVGGRRHLLFATDRQLELLVNARRAVVHRRDLLCYEATSQYSRLHPT